MRVKQSSCNPGETTVRVSLRPYQLQAFENRTNGIECWIWGRQTGKSYTLAAWAVDRIVTRPGRLVTILSNSLNNGAELNQKCISIARMYAAAFKNTGARQFRFETMNLEVRLTMGDAVGRIKILPANPRTARGFSGDLILDEFAFHEDSKGIWHAAEPILAANPDYLCRIASTPNGRQNMFYQIAHDPAIPSRRVPRSLAWQQGLRIFHPITRAPITPAEARDLAHDKRQYDQNYECLFDSENMALLPLELIRCAEDESVGFIFENSWPSESLAFTGKGDSNDPESVSRDLYVGVDVGRTRDLTVITVLQKQNNQFFVRAMLRLKDVRLPSQQKCLEYVCRSPRFACAQIDMTGLGLGLFEYTQQRFGPRIRGVNFSTQIPLANASCDSTKVRATEALAVGLLQVYEAKRIKHPIDATLRDDLRKPERNTNHDGRVAIVATRTSEGHADHFWSLALAVDAALRTPTLQVHVPMLRNRIRIPRNRLC